MVVKIVRFLVLGFSNVSGHNGSWLKSEINHHLEHIDSIVFEAMSSEISSFNIIIHSHSTSRHLDHTIVNSFVGMLKSLKIGVFDSEKRS